MNAFALFVGFASIIGIVMILSSILNGWVLSVLWGWFIVPTFGAPSISIVQAIGIALVVSFLTRKTDTKDDDTRSTKEKFAVASIAVFIAPAFALFFGWIVHFFM